MIDILSRANAMELVGTALFFLAIIHTFSVKYFQHLATKYPEGSVGENFYHLVGEVEIVFGLWAGLFLAYLVLIQGTGEAIHYLESRNFTEPAFVFVIMAICSTRPVLQVAGGFIDFISRLLPVNRTVAFYASALVLGPLFGSFITEPAAMTVTALLLLERIFSRTDSVKLKYATLGLLFVNVSIGGTLTSFAAPPVLMVAGTWGWDSSFMLTHFGWKAAITMVLATAVVTWRFRHELSQISHARSAENRLRTPPWVIALHLAFLTLVVLAAHHMVLFFGLFLFFLGVVTVTREYQEAVRLREGLLVAFFLGGLVILGGVQRWWLEPLLTQLNAASLFMGATGLTAITDNAALTYLGAQVPGLSDLSKYALVAGAVTGGGLTVIANAPNPAGYGILNSSFGAEGISPLGLLGAALPPTILAGLCFWFL